MTTNPPSEIRPALWNPNAAACWSLLFTPAFGAYLHAQNADSLGRVDEAKTNRAWFYASLGYLTFVLFSIFIPQIPEALYRGAAIGLLVGWYITIGKGQAQYVKDTWQTSYTRKPWTKPLLIASVCLIGYIALIVGLAIVADLFFGIE
jgi:hypothetical protein